MARKLRESLGQDAGGDFVTWLEAEREDRMKVHEVLAAFRADMNAMELRLTARIDAVDVRLSEVKSDLMKWSFVFWCGAVAAIAALAGVLRG